MNPNPVRCNQKLRMKCSRSRMHSRLSHKSIAMEPFNQKTADASKSPINTVALARCIADACDLSFSAQPGIKVGAQINLLSSTTGRAPLASSARGGTFRGIRGVLDLIFGTLDFICVHHWLFSLRLRRGLESWGC